MKKLIYTLLLTFLTLSVFPFQAQATDVKNPSSEASKPPEPVNTTILMEKAGKISRIDKTTLRPASTKNKQVEIEARTRHRHGGVVYISAGTIILVVVLLIVLL